MKEFDYNLFYQKDREKDIYNVADGFDNYRIKTYSKGTYIAMKGDLVHDLIIVLEGVISVEFVVDTGLVIRSVHHEAPTIIGAVGLFTNGGEYMVDTKVYKEVKALILSKEEVITRMQKDISFFHHFMTFITSRIENITSQIAVLAQKNIRAKLAYYIFTCSNGKYYKFDRKIRDLADYLCVERPSLSRIISKFVAEGLISYDKGKGEILSVENLKEELV